MPSHNRVNSNAFHPIARTANRRLPVAKRLPEKGLIQKEAGLNTARGIARLPARHARTYGMRVPRRVQSHGGAPRWIAPPSRPLGAVDVAQKREQAVVDSVFEHRL